MDWRYFLAGLAGAVVFDVLKLLTARQRVVKQVSTLERTQFDLLIAQGQIESYLAEINRLRAELRKLRGGG